MKKLGWEEHPEKTWCLISVGSYFRVNLSNIKKQEVNLCNSKALAEGKWRQNFQHRLPNRKILELNLQKLEGK